MIAAQLTQTESLTDALLGIWPLWLLALTFPAAALRRRWQVRRRQVRQDVWMHSHERGEGPTP